MTKQLNVFIENRPGRLKAVTGFLGENGINIRAMTIQDRGDYGLVKLLVDQPEKANLLLSENGFASACKDVVAVTVPDKPGALSALMAGLSEEGINIMNAYGFVVRTQEDAVIIIEADHPDRVNQIVGKAGYKVLDKAALYKI